MKKRLDQMIACKPVRPQAGVHMGYTRQPGVFGPERRDSVEIKDAGPFDKDNPLAMRPTRICCATHRHATLAAILILDTAAAVEWGRTASARQEGHR
jgi:hypothetical protein